MAAVPSTPKALGNKINTTLTGSINASDLTITVASGTGLNASGGFAIIDKGLTTEEIVYVESASGTTLTLATAGRGLQGTSASSHNSGASLQDVLVKDHVNGLVSAVATNTTNIATNTTNISTNTTAIDTINNTTIPALRIIPTGAFMYFATSPGTGWLRCDGSAVSRSTYSALFALFGTAFGSGNGSTTFNLPNTVGRTIVDFKTGDSDFGTVGATVGAKTHTLTEQELPAHTHQMYKSFGVSTGAATATGTSGDGFSGTTNNTNTTGNNTAHNNIQPSFVLVLYVAT